MGGFVPGEEVAGRRGTRVIVRPRFILWFLMALEGGGGGEEEERKRKSRERRRRMKEKRKWTDATFLPVFSKRKKKFLSFSPTEVFQFKITCVLCLFI